MVGTILRLLAILVTLPFFVFGALFIGIIFLIDYALGEYKDWTANDFIYLFKHGELSEDARSRRAAKED